MFFWTNFSYKWQIEKSKISKSGRHIHVQKISKTLRKTIMHYLLQWSEPFLKLDKN